MQNDIKNQKSEKLINLVNYKKGKKPSLLSDSPLKGYIPYVDIEAFEKKIVNRYSNDPSVPTSDGEKDILIVWDGARAGLVGTASGAVGSTLMKLTPKGVDRNYLLLFLKSKYKEITNNHRGTGIPHVNPDIFWDFNVPLVDLEEQVTIAKKTIDYLKIVETNTLKIAKAKNINEIFFEKLLYAAVTGRLTSDWREANGYEEWKVLPAEKVCDFITKGTTPKNLTKDSNGNIPFLKVYNIRNNKIDFEYNPSYVDKDTHDGLLKRSKVYPNDVLMNIVGPPLFKVALVPNSYPEWNINQAIAIFRPLNTILSRYLEIVLSCEQYTAEFLSLTRGVVGQSNISLQQCRAIPIPLPTLNEQKEIIKRVDTFFNITNNIYLHIQKAEQLAHNLNLAILNKVFTI